MAKTVTLIGGPMHRKVIAVPSDTLPSIRFPVSGYPYSPMVEAFSPTACTPYHEETYELRSVEIHGVKVAEIGLHTTCLNPPTPRLR